ncbi:MAG: hypothetical protein ACTSRP_23310 [Candidatus Helarchaeota archaeon]
MIRVHYSRDNQKNVYLICDNCNKVIQNYLSESETNSDNRVTHLLVRAKIKKKFFPNRPFLITNQYFLDYFELDLYFKVNDKYFGYVLDKESFHLSCLFYNGTYCNDNCAVEHLQKENFYNVCLKIINKNDTFGFVYDDESRMMIKNITINLSNLHFSITE